MIAAVVVSSALASVAPADQPSPAKQAVAVRLERMARAQANPLAEPSDDNLTVADILLEQANRLDATSAERWHLAARVSESLGRTEQAREALKRYISRRPGDDAAQLRLITVLTQQMQTVDERLRFFKRVVEGSAARQFSRPLRSRIAHAAAALEAEQGRPEEHLRLVGLALKLDPTNHGAAAEAYALVSADPDVDVARKAASLFTLFNAKPTDPLTHLAIADTLMAFGQYERALSWYATSAQLLRAAGSTPDLSMAQANAMALWGMGRGDEAARQLKALDAALKDQAPAPGDSVDGASTGEPPAAPGDTTPVEVLMLLGAITADAADPTERNELHDRIERSLITQLRDADDPGLMANLVWAHLLFDRGLGAVPELIDRLEAAQGDQPLLRGWLAAKRGERERAEKLLAGSVDTDPRAALGLAHALAASEAQADQQRRRTLLESVAQTTPDNIFGLTAVARLGAMGIDPPAPAEGKRIDALFSKVPLSLQRMYADPLQFVSLRIQAVDARPGLTDPLEVRIELRNNAAMPLSVGADGVLPARLLLMPTLNIGRGRPVGGAALISLDRAIRIESQRSIELVVRLDALPSVGDPLASTPQQRVQIDLSAVLNPTLTEAGGVQPGLLGARTQLRNLARRGGSIDAEQLDKQVDAIAGSDEAAAARALSLLLPLAGATDLLPGQQDAVARAATTLEANYDSLEPAVRALAVLCLPDSDSRATFGKFIERAQRDADPLVQTTALVTLSDESDQTLLNAAARGRNATLKRLATAYKRLLTQQAETDSADEDESGQTQ